MTLRHTSPIITTIILTITISAVTLFEGSQMTYASQTTDTPSSVDATVFSYDINKNYCEEYKIRKSEEKGNQQLLTEAGNSDCFAENLSLASETNQLIVVSAPYYSSGTANISYYIEKENGWEEEFSVDGFIGRNGLGKTREGDGKTPVGVYSFTKAFGNKAIDYCQLDYLQVDSSYYWVDDSYSQYYNQMVSTNSLSCDWGSAEHIAGIGSVYNYCLALSYNEDCVPGTGSAIFLHCSGGHSTSGCISIPEEYMRQLLENINDKCLILIDSQENLSNY